MLGDLILVFLATILAGAFFMCFRLWRERQHLRNQYTQIPSVDPFDVLENGKAQRGGMRGMSTPGRGARDTHRSSYKKKSNTPRSQPVKRYNKKSLEAEIGTPNGRLLSPGHAPEIAKNAAIRAATFCRNSPYYKWLDVSLAQWTRREEKQFFMVEYCPDAVDDVGKDVVVEAVHQKNTRKFEVVLSLYTVRGCMTTIVANPEQFDIVVYALTSIRHPYLLPTWEIDIISNRPNELPVIAVGNPFITGGSLRDLIYKVHNPMLQHQSMYKQGGRPLRTNKIRVWGRQILEALIALKKHGFSNTPLHCGNVLVLSDAVGSYRVVLTGYESSLFGYRTFNKTLDRLIRKAVSKRKAEPLAVTFGFMFFEMAFGMKLEFSKPDYTGLNASRRRWNSPFRRILDLIFEGCWMEDNEEPLSEEDEDAELTGKKEGEKGNLSTLEVDAAGDEIIDAENAKTDYAYPQRKKGRVKLEELASLGFFQPEDVGIMSVPLELTNDSLDEAGIERWHEVLSECCASNKDALVDKGRTSAYTHSTSPLTDGEKPAVVQNRRGRYSRARKLSQRRKGSLSNSPPPCSQGPVGRSPELPVTVEDTVAEEMQPEAVPETHVHPTLGAEYDTFKAMLKVGVPEGAVRAKMGLAGVDPEPLFNKGGFASTTVPSSPARRLPPESEPPGSSSNVLPPEASGPQPGRMGMLAGITGFRKGNLKKTITVDKSKPVGERQATPDDATPPSTSEGGSIADMLKKQFAARGMG